MPSTVCRALIAALCVPLALFFAFVGWNKAFAPLADLARHGAWTIHLPEAAGRLVGWSEMACAVLLLTAPFHLQRPVALLAALGLVANQLVAGAVHLTHGEAGALPQNAVLILMLLALASLSHTRKWRGKE